MTEWGGVIGADLGDLAFMPEKPPELEIFRNNYGIDRDLPGRESRGI